METAVARSAPSRASSRTLPPPKQNPTAAPAFIDQIAPFACAIIVSNAALTPASPNSPGRGPAPYMLATKTAQRFPATNSPRSIALSVPHPIRRHEHGGTLPRHILVIDQSTLRRERPIGYLILSARICFLAKDLTAELQPRSQHAGRQKGRSRIPLFSDELSLVDGPVDLPVGGTMDRD